MPDLILISTNVFDVCSKCVKTRGGHAQFVSRNNVLKWSCLLGIPYTFDEGGAVLGLRCCNLNSSSGSVPN
jgi:hypothetical protein